MAHQLFFNLTNLCIFSPRHGLPIKVHLSCSKSNGGEATGCTWWLVDDCHTPPPIHQRREVLVGREATCISARLLNFLDSDKPRKWLLWIPLWPPSAWISAMHWPAKTRPSPFRSTSAQTLPSPWTPRRPCPLLQRLWQERALLQFEEMQRGE